MKILVVVLATGLLFCGCATYNHSEYIDTDQLGGYASGKYTNNSGGLSGSFALAGSGGSVSGSGGAGFGVGALVVNSGPPNVSPYNFARAVAMINYSKQLKSIKYDEVGGIVEYNFEQQPLSKRSSYQAPAQSSQPSSFGHQPVE